MSRRILIALLGLSKPDIPGDGVYFGPTKHYLEIEVAYNEGGMNYFNGTRPARGYYLRVTPVTKQETKNGSTTGFTMFSGTSALLEPATRYSAKTLNRIAKSAKDSPEYERLKMLVLTRENLTLAS